MAPSSVIPKEAKEGLPIHTGRLTMIQNDQQESNTLKCRTFRIILNIYRSSYGCFAVVSQDRDISKDFGCITLKNSTIKTMDNFKSDRTENCQKGSRGQCRFQIIPRDMEGNALTFEAENVKEMNNWVEKLTPMTLNESRLSPTLGVRRISRSASPRTVSPLLPALEEE